MLPESPQLSIETVGKHGDALVLPVAFNAEASRHEFFWLQIAGTNDRKIVGWVKFERRTALSSKALFEATELRPACSGAIAPEPVLPAWTHLPLGGL